MSQNIHHQADDQLLAKYLSGEANPEEAMLMEKWLTDPANYLRFRKLSLVWTELGGEMPHLLPGQDSEWKKILAELNTRILPDSKSNYKIIYRAGIAASILVIFTIALYFIYSDRTIQSSTETARLITRQAGNRLLYDTLPDASTLVLNSNARVQYPQYFSGANRQLQLMGEAWFDIQPDPHKPFTIQAGPVLVKVLGTSFNIFENTDSVVVSLASGSVRLYAGTDSITLQPNQRGIYDIAARKFIIDGKYSPNKTGYATRIFEFRNASLKEITDCISKAYGIDILFTNQALADCTMSSSFENQSIGYIMNVIAATLGIEFKIENEKVYLSGNGCE